MIITCEQCDTRFRLDDERIPDKGARVRCSRCKHAFHVQKPGTSVDDALAEVVAEATHPGTPAAPPATQDLPGPGETDPGLSSSLEAFGNTAPDEDEVWEFDDDPPAPLAQIPAASAPEADAAPDPAAPVAPATTAAEPGVSEFAFDDDGTGDADGGLELDFSAGEGGLDLGSDDPEPPAAAEPEPPSPPASPAPPAAVEFDADAVTAPAAAPPPPPGATRASTSPEPTGRPGSPLDDIGSPDEWDFLSDGGGTSAPVPASTNEATPAPAASAEATATEAAAPRVDRDATTVETPAPAARRSLRAPAWLVASGVAGLVTTMLVTMLLAAAVALTFRSAPPPAVAPLASARFDLGNGLATGVTERILENAVAGTVVVVSGDFEVRERTDRGLVVRWVDAAGRPLGEAAIAGPPAHPGALRERSVEQLQASYAASAFQLAHGGHFEAVLSGPPEGAAGYRVEAAAERFVRPQPAAAEDGTEVDEASATTARLR